MLFIKSLDRIQAMHKEPGGITVQISLTKRRYNIKYPCYRILTTFSVGTMADVSLSFV